MTSWSAASSSFEKLLAERPKLARRIAALEAQAADRHGADRAPDLSVLTDDELRFLRGRLERPLPGHRPAWQEAAAGLDQAGRDTLDGIATKLAATLLTPRREEHGSYS